MKDSVLIFGGGVLQLSIIDQVKLMGYDAVVIDPNPNAPGRGCADFFYEVKGDDFNGTCKIATQHNVKGIVTAATDNPILMMCRVARKMNFQFPSYESCDTILDKGKFKIFLQTNNFPHAKGHVFNSIEDALWQEHIYPCIIKPIKSSGSRGIIKCDHSDQLKKGVIETLKFCKDGKFIIEEYLNGDEVSVEVIVSNKVVNIIQITDKIVSPPPYNVELGHLQPSKHFNRLEEIRELLQKIVDLTQIDNCALHPELKINGKEITIIEIGTRLGGDFITSDLTPLSTGINIEQELINLSVGKKYSKKHPKDHYAYIRYFDLPKGILEYRKNVQNEIHHKNLVRLEFELENNQEVPQITNSLNRYGSIIVKGNSKEEVVRSMEEVYNSALLCFEVKAIENSQ